MMANDFGFYDMKTFELPRRFDSPGVPSSPLESSPVLEIYWRRNDHFEHQAKSVLFRSVAMPERYCE